MKGMELARKFYESCRPVLTGAIPDIMAQAAIGLVGEGSECFGTDDELSRDHDFGAGFCLWVPDDLLASHGPEIEKALAMLPAEFEGQPSRLVPALSGGRVGPLGIKAFYAFFTGLEHAPESWREWLNLPEEQLAAATNGAVFEDNRGEFTAWREKLLAFYPRDVWLKKIVARVMIMAQAGQYNLPRVLRRDDGAAAMLAVSRFADAALSLVYLLNRRYMPYYKWAPRLCRDLPILGAELTTLLDALARHPLRGRQDLDAAEMVEDFCGACAAHLHASDLSGERDPWLWAHGPSIISRVENADIARLNLLRA